ncbi:MAG: hypothetical protein ACI8RZ_004940 [Myxococcota bacterium]|jgi:hypothetical protein
MPRKWTSRRFGRSILDATDSCELWVDYSMADPGITIMEMLSCFITDLCISIWSVCGEDSEESGDEKKEEEKSESEDETTP